MERLYKRLVTVGMITVTTVLAWIYCILEYRDEAVYVIVASLLVVSSLYVLLLTYISLKNDKESKLRNFISDTIAQNLIKLQNNGNEDDVLRLLKAMYVQIRKRNESDTNELVVASINKAMKVIIKYNQSNNDAMLASIENLSAELAAIKSKLETMPVVTPVVDATPSVDDFSITGDATLANATGANLDLFPDESSSSNRDISDVAPATEEQQTTSDISADEASQMPSDEQLAEAFFEAFGMEDQKKEDAVADVIPFPANGTESDIPSTIATPE